MQHRAAMSWSPPLLLLLLLMQARCAHPHVPGWDEAIQKGLSRLNSKKIQLRDWQRSVVDSWRDGKDSFVLSSTGNAFFLCPSHPCYFSHPSPFLLPNLSTIF